MDTHILKEKSELFVFPLIFIQIAKLLTEHDLSWAFPNAYCYFYCHCQLSFSYQEWSLDEDALIFQSHKQIKGDVTSPRIWAPSGQWGTYCWPSSPKSLPKRPQLNQYTFLSSFPFKPWLFCLFTGTLCKTEAWSLSGTLPSAGAPQAVRIPFRAFLHKIPAVLEILDNK